MYISNNRPVLSTCTYRNSLKYGLDLLIEKLTVKTVLYICVIIQLKEMMHIFPIKWGWGNDDMELKFNEWSFPMLSEFRWAILLTFLVKNSSLQPEHDTLVVKLCILPSNPNHWGSFEKKTKQTISLHVLKYVPYSNKI